MKLESPVLIRIPLLLSVLLLSCLLDGCGYRVGSLVHPQIKTVAIADVKNESYEVLASAIMRKILAERFQFDNSLKLTSLEKADCIVYVRITNVYNRSVSWRNTNRVEDYRANEYTLQVSAEYTVLRPGVALPMVPKSSANGVSTYLFAHDPAIGREGALKQCLLQIADRIVSSTVEAW